METNLIEKRNLLISSLFQGGSSFNLPPAQLLNATLFVWQRRYKNRGVRAKISLHDIKAEDRQLSLLALQVSFGIERSSIIKAFGISYSTFMKDIALMSVAILNSHKFQRAYAVLCVDILYYARWHYQHQH